MSEHVVYVTAVAGWDETQRLVVCVCADENVEKPSVLAELPLGLSWSSARSADQPPAWHDLTRRADVALAENGWVRTVGWSHHVRPQPLAQTGASRSG
jgi:hypothetical protein